MLATCVEIPDDDFVGRKAGSEGRSIDDGAASRLMASSRCGVFAANGVGGAVVAGRSTPMAHRSFNDFSADIIRFVSVVRFRRMESVCHVDGPLYDGAGVLGWPRL